jgi:hypothetical protein
VDFDMRDVVEYAKSKGFPIPPPITGEERLVKEFSQVAREETRQDAKTGRPYRVCHAFRPDGKGQGVFYWFNIDNEKAPRKYMLKSAIMYREQMVGEAVQLTLDLEHWNNIHPNEEPITMPMDFGPDVEWPLKGPEQAAA